MPDLRRSHGSLLANAQARCDDRTRARARGHADDPPALRASAHSVVAAELHAKLPTLKARRPRKRTAEL